MTMRTYCHFTCPNGHEGIEKTSENDQPYSKMWERVTLTGMVARELDNKNQYFCLTCGLLMALKQ